MLRVLAAGVLAGLPGLLASTNPVPPGGEGADGRIVNWQGWSFRWEVLPRQGVVLRQISFQGRTVLKYAGLAEVFVPYHSGSPRPMDQREHPFGENIILLEPGVDCLPGGACRAFTPDGKPAKERAAVMLHEESPSLVYLGGGGKARVKTLTLWSAHALGDYSYILRWHFREDGCLMPQVGMTGKLSHFGGDASNSTEVGAANRALAHVHNFFYCLDFDIDGPKNVVEEFSYKLADAEGTTARTSWTPITREGGRELKPEAFRSWRVVNPASKNRLGHPRSYELVPGGTGVYRGGRSETFAHADLWLTRHKKKEVPGERLLAEGLMPSVDGESLVNEDVVLWYMLSVHHQPRTEDWPAMPVDWHGFKLVPRDFLDSSPLKPQGELPRPPENLPK
jgi:primary-amine oxidase